MGKKITLEEMKKIEVDIMKQIDKICRENNLKYSLMDGSLIGAVRHNGFIPWDDDIDVGMLRKDYEKFIVCCNHELNNDFAFYNYNNSNDYPHPFGKLKIKNTQYVESMSVSSDMNHEIFIDIFPYDNSPKSYIKCFFHKIHIKFYRKILLLKCKFDIIGNSLLKRIIYLPLVLLSKIFSYKFCVAKLDKISRKYNNIDSDYVVNIGGSYSYNKERLPKEWIINLIEHRFEDDIYHISKYYHEQLKHTYGDYMALPPIEKRFGRHEIVKIELGNYIPKSVINKVIDKKLD